MAIYADEDAVANSNRAFHQVTIERSVPWAEEVMELIDELAGEKLPAALIEPVLEPRRAQHAGRRAAIAAQARARERVAELEPRVDELGEDELSELEQAGRMAYGEYTTRAYALRDKVRTRRAVIAAAAAAGSDSDSDQDADAPEAIDGAVVDEEPDVDVDDALEPRGDVE
jgi:hypothetical protein